MRIDQIEIQNFRCFNYLKLNLHPEFNVLIGENGAGKTAILEAIAVALGTGTIGTSEEPRPITTDDVRLVGRRFGHETSFEPQSPVKVISKGQLYGQEKVWGRSPERPNARFDDATLGKLVADIEARVRAGEQVLIPIISYYSGERLLPSLGEVYGAYPPLTQRELSRLESRMYSRPGQMLANWTAGWSIRIVSLIKRSEKRLYIALR